VEINTTSSSCVWISANAFIWIHKSSKCKTSVSICIRLFICCNSKWM